MNRRIFLLVGFFIFLTSFIKIKWFNKLLANIVKKNQTQILTHKIFYNHLFNKNHPERPERLINILNIFNPVEKFC